jgi:signal transduction histidine kinase
MRAEELVGRDLREALPFQDRAGESWWEIASPWEGLSTRTGHREKLLVLPTGKEVLVTSRYLRRGRGLPVVAVVVGLRDAEARRRAEADSAALLTTVAHELRSPLTGVKGFSSTLLRNWDRFTDDQKRMMIETIEADADRVTRLITELLDVSRIHAGRLRVHPQPVQVHEVYEREVARRSATGAERERFTIDLPEDLPAIWADPDRLDQIVSNLVENAVRHGRGQVRLGATRSFVGEIEAVDLTIADDGDGIPESHRELVFSRFWQGGAKQGTGLGLYLVRGLVQAHGGRIGIEDAPGGGCLVRVVFPAHDPREYL